MRKQLEIILTALFPMMVLAVGYFVVSSKVPVQANQQTIDPAGADPYYGSPGVGGKYFGTEIRSNDLCGEKNGFNILGTTESADIYRIRADNGNLGIRWTRTQSWYFAGAPWGDSPAYVTKTDDMGWSEVEEPGQNETGFPWEGSETHDRYVHYDVKSKQYRQYIFTNGDVTGYEQYEDSESGIKYVCPRYYKSVINVIYNCTANNTHWADATYLIVEKEYFGPINIVNGIAFRNAEKGDYSGTFFCIELD